VSGLKRGHESQRDILRRSKEVEVNFAWNPEVDAFRTKDFQDLCIATSKFVDLCTCLRIGVVY